MCACLPSVPVCPHAGGVGLCELVQHLILFDYICVSGSLTNRYRTVLFIYFLLLFFDESQLVLFILFFHFFIRMCEYVDHLHEHFASPVVIRNANYMAPKVRSIHAKVYFSLASTFLTLCPVFRILDILVRCWNHRCSLIATRRETYGWQS